MRAVTISEPGSPDVLGWSEVPDPVCGPGEVLVDVAATAVNRADLMQRQGFYPPPKGASEILGLECSGVISEVGEGVVGWSVGDEVCALLSGGGYAERVAVPAGQLLPRPAGVELATAAALPEVARSWGWMLQLYALHSQGSWGIGDLGDLREFVGWTGREHAAAAVLLNPLHAITPVPPVQASPYTPSSRRFATPLALRVTDLELYREAGEATRAEVDALRPDTVDDRIDHDRVWARHQSLTLPEHASAAQRLRRERIGLVRPAAELDVETRRLADYDTALGLTDHDSDSDHGGGSDGLDGGLAGDVDGTVARCPPAGTVPPRSPTSPGR